MLAMEVQTPRASRQPTPSLTTIASVLAPAGSANDKAPSLDGDLSFALYECRKIIGRRVGAGCGVHRRR